jgi:hypothetical protein
MTPENAGGPEVSNRVSNGVVEKIRRALVVNDAALFDEVIRLAANYLNLEENGRVHIKDPEGLRGNDLVALFLIGKWLAKVGGLCNSDVAEIEEVVEVTGLKRTVAFARLHELKKEDKVEIPDRGQYRVVASRVRAILSALKMRQTKED